MSLASTVLFRSLAAAVLAATSSAQVQVTWSTLAGGAEDAAESTTGSALDAAGATFLVGTLDVDPSAATSYDAVLTKVDSDGVVEWVRTYDEPGGGAQFFELVGVDAAGNVAVVGTQSGAQTVVARYDTSGNRLWLRGLTDSSGASPRILAMRVAPTGDLLLAGYVEPAGSYADAFVARIRPDGTTAWTHVHAGSSGWSDSATDLVLDAAGNVFVTGQAGANDDVINGLFALELGFDGTLAWSTEFLPPATAGRQGQHAAVDAQGRLFVADTVLAGSHEYLGLVQFDANGVRVWDRQALDTDGAQVVGIAVRADGSVLVGAAIAGTSWAAGQAFVGAWDATGAALWSATYTAPGSVPENLTDFDLDPAGGAILTGWQSAAPNSNVLFVAHVTDAGEQDWTQLFGGGWSYERAAELEVAADDSLRVRSSWHAFSGDPHVRLRRLEHDVTAFCSGDGSATSCPCDNGSGPRSGCANSLGVGAALRAYGSASIAFDTLLLTCIDLPPTTTVTFFQGSARVAGGSGVVFGDGLRCAGGSVVRLGTRTAFSGTTGFPSPGQALSLIGLVATPGLRTYQGWYRNSASFCTPDTFNTSNGLAVLWRP